MVFLVLFGDFVLELGEFLLVGAYGFEDVSGLFGSFVGVFDVVAAADFLAELAEVFRTFGEERFAGRIAKAIVAQRQRVPIRTTTQLFEVVTAALPARVRWRAARSTARVFQALRIAVNDELQAIAQALPQALALLAPGGHLAVIAFHSLEDRLVKQFFVAERQAGHVRILTKKPLRPGEEEVAANRRAASAKLRVCERTET